MRRQDEINCVAARPLASGQRGHPVGGGFDLRAGVGGGDGQAADAQDGQVDDVVAHIGEFLDRDAGLLDDLVHGVQLVRLTLVDEFVLQVAGADGDGLRLALGDDAGAKAAEARERDAETVVRVEGFGLEAAAVEFGDDGDGAIGEDAVDVEDEDFDLAGACLCVFKRDHPSIVGLGRFGMDPCVKFSGAASEVVYWNPVGYCACPGVVMLIALFFLIVLSPCFVAFFSGEPAEDSLLRERQIKTWALPRFKREKAYEAVLKLEEEPVSEGFELRSFAKGISQRRVVIQDALEGVRMTIAEVRAVVAEAARTAHAFYQSFRESRTELLDRLADQARITLAHAILRDGREGRASGEEYAAACHRLRWSESTTEAGWSTERLARVAA